MLKMMTLQMAVGVLDARLDPFGAADSGLAGWRDDLNDGGEATAVLAAGLPVRADGDYSDELYDGVSGVGGAGRFSFVLFVSLGSSFVAAGMAFADLSIAGMFY